MSAPIAEEDKAQPLERLKRATLITLDVCAPFLVGFDGTIRGRVCLAG